MIATAGTLLKSVFPTFSLLLRTLSVVKAGTGGNTSLTNLNVQALAIDPVVPDTLYAGTAGGGVFKSTNGGSSRGPVNTGL